MKKLLKTIGILLLVVAAFEALYVGGNMLFGTLTDYKPAASESVEIYNPRSLHPTDSTLSLLIWNIGYSGLGDEEDFFFDGGKLVRPSKDRVLKNLEGITATIRAHADADFILIQEADRHSKRSYFTNEVEAIARALPEHAYSFALNYNVGFVPAPLYLPPWNAMGHVESGVLSFSRFEPQEATRYSLPGEFGWPKRPFWLDRCLLLWRFNMPAGGKQLVVINQHLEAYDEGGSVKKQEMAFLKDLIIGEYEKCNYVIVGGDWNQCPPEFDYQHFGKDADSSYVQLNVPADFIPGWKWAYDSNTPSNRKLAKPYEPGKTFVTLIDFFLVSPNVKVIEAKGINVDFRYSDHQPVLMRVAMESRK